MSRAKVRPKQQRVASLHVLLTPKESAYIDRFAKADMLTRSGYGRRIIVEHIKGRLVNGSNAGRADGTSAG